MQLYKLTENYNNLLELLEDETIPQNLIEDSLKDVKGEIEDKAENIAKIVKTLDAEAKALKEEEKRLSDRRKSLENRSKGLKTYLQTSLEAVNLKQVKTQLFTVAIQKNTPSVNIVDEKKIPDNYFVTTKEVLKDLIKKDLKDGKVIDGVELKQSESLRIR